MLPVGLQPTARADAAVYASSCGAADIALAETSMQVEAQWWDSRGLWGLLFGRWSLARA